MSQCFFLILSGIITSSLSVSWNMTVSPVVSVWREDAVLSCSFTHPRQQTYSGMITVKWMARMSSGQPFFQCSVKNDSVEGLGDCSGTGFRYSLDGDPRQGALSLLIRRVQLTDNGVYYCRVELDEEKNSFQKPTNLEVTAKPQILSLSVVELSSSPDGATRRLQCEVEGHPQPTITWLSASRSLSGDQVRTSGSGPYRLMSSVPYLEEDKVITCRAENRLGSAEWRYPHSYTLLITLTVCGSIVLLLLLLTGFIIYCLKHRARAETPSEYENVATVENHRLRGSEAPADGDVEPQLVYCAVSLHCSTSSQHASFKSSTQAHEETDVIYSDVTIQK